MIEFSVNYSPRLAGLIRAGRAPVDRYKCPAWPDLLTEAAESLPLYIHFPLTVGSGEGGPQNEEKKAPADLGWIADLLAQTGTPLVNTHLTVAQTRYPSIPFDSREPAHLQMIIDSALRDLEPLIHRFGAERVTVENVINDYGWLTGGVLPEVMHAILEQSGCGFLFDLSHARLAARNLGLDERSYIRELPVERIREVHVTGLQVLEGDLLAHMIAIGAPFGSGTNLAGKTIDHLSMIDADWPEMEWMMAQIHGGQGWGEPWVVAYEYGGVGPFWDDVTDEQVYLDQLPRMAALVKGDGRSG